MSQATTTRTIIPIVAADDAAVQVVSMYRAENKIYPRAVGGWFAA